MDRLIRQWRLFMDVHIVILDYHYRILSAFWTFNFHLCSRLPLTEPATAIRTHSVFHIKTSFSHVLQKFVFENFHCAVGIANTKETHLLQNFYINSRPGLVH